MALFLDTSDAGEAAELFDWGVLSGITTNPLLMAKSGAGSLEAGIREILKVGFGPVSVELVGNSVDDMLEEAHAYFDWDPRRIVVKVPMGERGLQVVNQLDGIPTNVTCVMSANQAYLAALAGATYVSIFSGRIRDMGYEARPIISSARNLLARENIPTEIIVGSIRHVMDVNEALAAGAHIVTVPPDILRKMTWNPRTTETINEFNQAWSEHVRALPSSLDPRLRS